MKLFLVLPIVCLAVDPEESCLSANCVDTTAESDDGALVQLRWRPTRPPSKQYTRPSDRKALLAFWNANMQAGGLTGWGEGDPCIGDPPAGQPNSQGFGPWKGVACVPCSDNPSGDEFCVSQLWSHRTGLFGTIPETFRGLSELEFLFLSNNNITGPMPQNNWFTFPKLRYLDIAYNMINGTLPLDRLSSLSELRTIQAHDNHFDAVCYHGGGFPELRHLDMKYNRNMTGTFPSEPLSYLPKLRFLVIHDTHLTGPIFNGPWPAMENFLFSGSGDLCGFHPDVCMREGVFCDVPETVLLPNCPDIVFGTPLAGFHNVTLWVYQQAMEMLGIQVKMITDTPHPQLFPMFLGTGGLDAGCKEDGCADVCRELGIGPNSPCVDFVVDSILPINHGDFLRSDTEVYDVMGTAVEDITVDLYAPNYTGWRTIDDAANALKAGNAESNIVGFKGTIQDKCGTMFCPECGTGDVPYITGAPLSTAGYTYEPYTCPEFEKHVAKKLKRKKNFIAYMWRPQVFEVVFPELSPLNLLNYTYQIKPNVGKAMIRKDSRYKFSPKALSVLGAVFIGSEGVKVMDAWSHGYGLDPPRQLCDYQSWEHACSKEAAKLWIEQNKNHPPAQGVVETWFW